MNAVIICDDIEFAANAASTLAQVGSVAGVNVFYLVTNCQTIDAMQEDEIKLS